jgi:hypothetical protein
MAPPTQKRGFKLKSTASTDTKTTGWNHDYPGINIKYLKAMTNAAKGFFGADYFHTVINHLNKIKSKPLGKQLLKRLTAAYQNSGGRISVTIEEPDRWHAQSEGGALDPTKIVGKISRKSGSCSFEPGEGSATKLTYNPDFIVIEDGKRVPSWITLAHELIHCLHNMEGTKYRELGGNLDEDSGSAEEEARTCGIGVYSDEQLSENSIRDEHKIPRRKTYGGHDMSWVSHSLN